MKRGIYIAVEGPEGCGKSTQVKAIAERIGAIATKEPGGTEIGAMIRSILLDLHDAGSPSSACEALLMAADRAQHANEILIPALERGITVISDRSIYSTLAYQGYGRGLDMGFLAEISGWALAGHWPDLVILLDVPTNELTNRRTSRDLLDRMEVESIAFHNKVLDGFRSMAMRDPDRWITVDGSGNPSDVTERIMDKLVKLGVYGE